MAAQSAPIRSIHGVLLQDVNAGMPYVHPQHRNTFLPSCDLPHVVSSPGAVAVGSAHPPPVAPPPTYDGATGALVATGELQCMWTGFD